MSYDDPFENMAPDSDGDFFDDDFQELVRDKTEAKGQGDRSDIARDARVRQIQEDRRIKAAPYVRINPVSANKGTLGNTTTITPGAPARDVVNWYAESDEETTTLTVTVAQIVDAFGNIPSINTTSTSADNRLFAELRWGNRAVPSFARVDLLKGQQFTLTGSFVSVAIGCPLTSAGNLNGSTFQVGAWISFYAAPRTAPATMTIYLDSLGASASTPAAGVAGYLLIPAWAKQLLPIQRTPLSNAMTLIFYDNNATAIARLYGGDTDYSVMTNSMPLSNDMHGFVVTNDGAASLTARFIFELAF